MKTRAAFCMNSTPLTRISRQVCKDILQILRSARQPFQPINIALIRQECMTRMSEKRQVKTLVKRKRKNLNACSAKMGTDITYKPALLEHTAVIKEPAVYAFPKGPVPRKYSQCNYKGYIILNTMICDDILIQQLSCAPVKPPPASVQHPPQPLLLVDSPPSWESADLTRLHQLHQHQEPGNQLPRDPTLA